MRKSRSTLLKSLAVFLVAAVALTSVIPINAEDDGDRTSDSARVYPAYTFTDLSDGTVSVAQYAYDMANEWNEKYAGKPIPNGVWELLQEHSEQAGQLGAWLPPLIPAPRPVAPSRTSVLPVGTNGSFYSGTYKDEGWSGAWYGSHWELGDDATRKNRASCQIGSAGIIESWATTGEFIIISGSGSRNANIDIFGQAGALLFPSYFGVAGWIVFAEVWDVTGPTSILISAPPAIFSDATTYQHALTPGGYYHATIPVTLQAGRMYAVRVVTYTRVEEKTGTYPAPQCQVDAGKSLGSQYSTTWSRIDINWR